MARARFHREQVVAGGPPPSAQPLAVVVTEGHPDGEPALVAIEPRPVDHSPVVVITSDAPAPAVDMVVGPRNMTDSDTGLTVCPPPETLERRARVRGHTN